MTQVNFSHQNATGSTTALRYLKREAFSLNDKMEQAIIKIVKENGGLVRTDNPQYDTIYGYIFNEEIGTYVERKILALATGKYNELSILPGAEYTTLGDMTNDEILECEEWDTVMGGMVLANATLLNICEILQEYV